MEDYVPTEYPVLFLTGSDLDLIVDELPGLLEDIIPRESLNHDAGRLLLWLESPSLNEDKYQDWHEMHNLLTKIYIRATEVKHRLDKLLFEVDVVLRRSGSGTRGGWSESRHSFGFKVTRVYHKRLGEF